MSSYCTSLSKHGQVGSGAPAPHTKVKDGLADQFIPEPGKHDRLTMLQRRLLGVACGHALVLEHSLILITHVTDAWLAFVRTAVTQALRRRIQNRALER